MSLVTYEGTVFDYQNPTKEMINIKDIFRSLPRLNRFVGHSSRAYSVGEHTMLCLAMASILGYSVREQLLVFIHDFTEAYVGDCPAPLKRLLPDFDLIEGKVEVAICEYLGIEPPTPEEHVKVKRIDLTMLVIEMRDLTVHDWEIFIGEHTYVEVLAHELFNLKDKETTESRVREGMENAFWSLLEMYKKEYSNDSTNETV